MLVMHASPCLQIGRSVQGMTCRTLHYAGDACAASLRIGQAWQGMSQSTLNPTHKACSCMHEFSIHASRGTQWKGVRERTVRKVTVPALNSWVKQDLRASS